ncbi:MAG: rRNA maturation RNase YbeY [Candidatus Marinimicrobia bacterium]|nr:rRNA maturation RNase YbeY [Candidatus Neomarinimicrobiota bacterium]
MPYVELINLYPKLFLLRPAIERLVNFLAGKECKRVKKITIVVSDDKILNELKKKYFGEDLLTDTISFNFNQKNEPVEGEIYISIDRIKENAKDYNESFDRELVRVLIHSILHLFGYEDQTPQGKKQMEALQNFYLLQQDFKRFYRKRHTISGVDDG